MRCPCHDRCPTGCPCGFYNCGPNCTNEEDKEAARKCGDKCIEKADEFVDKCKALRSGRFLTILKTQNEFANFEGLQSSKTFIQMTLVTRKLQKFHSCVWLIVLVVKTAQLVSPVSALSFVRQQLLRRLSLQLPRLQKLQKV